MVAILGKKYFCTLLMISKTIRNTLSMGERGLIDIPPFPASTLRHEVLESCTTDGVLGSIVRKWAKTQSKSWTYLICKEISCIPKRRWYASWAGDLLSDKFVISVVVLKAHFVAQSFLPIILQNKWNGNPFVIRGNRQVEKNTIAAGFECKWIGCL